jgi:hypothetical protein
VRWWKNWHQIAVRDGLYRAMQEAFDHAGIPWADCDHEDRGDGVFVLIPPDVPKELLIESLPPALVTTLDRHNSTHQALEQIRLRMALHAGEISYDEHGTTAAAVNMAFRLSDADALKTALAASRSVLAVIASSWFFQEVVRHNPACNADAYRRVRVAVAEQASPMAHAMPKSVRTTRPPPQRCTLAGLTSPCTMPARCVACSTSKARAECCHLVDRQVPRNVQRLLQRSSRQRLHDDPRAAVVLHDVVDPDGSVVVAPRGGPGL